MTSNHGHTRALGKRRKPNGICELSTLVSRCDALTLRAGLPACLGQPPTRARRPWRTLLPLLGLSSVPSAEAPTLALSPLGKPAPEGPRGPAARPRPNLVAALVNTG